MYHGHDPARSRAMYHFRLPPISTMQPIRPAALFVLLTLSVGALTACFIEPAQPSVFRYDCAAHDECATGESCLDGLCQRACTLGAEGDGLLGDCPDDSGYVACINGSCSHTCEAESAACPAPQSCVDLGAVFGGGAASSLDGLGACAVACDAAHPCSGAAGYPEVCFESVCVAAPDPTTTGTAGSTSSGGTGTAGSGTGTGADTTGGLQP